MKKNQEIIIYGDGKSSRDYIYIDDLVEIIDIFCSKNINSKINVSSNYEVKMEYLKQNQQLIFQLPNYLNEAV